MRKIALMVCLLGSVNVVGCGPDKSAVEIQGTPEAAKKQAEMQKGYEEMMKSGQPAPGTAR